MEAANSHITQNNKVKHTFAIYHLLHPPSCKHAHSRGSAANFSSRLFKHFICFIKRFTHITFCCNKQLNLTFLLSSLTQPRLLQIITIAHGDLYSSMAIWMFSPDVPPARSPKENLPRIIPQTIPGQFAFLKHSL